MTDKEIHFDTHGITNECPIVSGDMTSCWCYTCEWNRGSHGFTMFCGYVEKPPASKETTTIDKKVITDNSKESLIVEYHRTGIWLTQKTKGQFPNTNRKTIIMNEQEVKGFIKFILDTLERRISVHKS